jgi:hypothetical protein
MTTFNSNSTSQEEIHIIRNGTSVNGNWIPLVGDETINLLEYLKISKESKESVLREAVNILSHCSPPDSLTRDNQTGLVIGYVQSGKTMSFTTVTALARDNHYQLVIVITGTSKPLFQQSTERLVHDMRLTSRGDRIWRAIQNPRAKEETSIRETLADWKDSSLDDNERQTVLITVMKNGTHLRNLCKVLSKIDLYEVPTLIIDDEADQASMNTKVGLGEESTIYRLLLKLREQVPHHSYLQYTATPQAPLLINIIDMLSPTFVELLTPGIDYVGGKDFFYPSSKYVKRIPNNDLIQTSMPPDTLVDAMRLFFIGVAIGLKQDGGHGNRSMMVHPSQRTDNHGTYFDWVKATREQWKVILDLESSDPDRHELIEDFELAYHDLSDTLEGIPPFEEVISKLPHAIRRTHIEQVNATGGHTPLIDWQADYSHILVGGQAMDRGFTVEGLTITYMPRSLGVGNADTVQQRARFFGYKRNYLGFCRVYLETLVSEVYEQYVSHEEDIRQRLLEFRNTGKPLTEWKRAFFLTGALRPTRDNVLSLDYMRGMYSDDWVWPKSPHYSDSALRENQVIVSHYMSVLSMQDDEGHSARTIMQRHKVTTVKLSDVYENLLVQYKLAFPPDSQRFTGMLLQIQRYLESHPDESCTIYSMIGGEARKRSLDDNVIPTLHQGSNSHGNEMIYPGDSAIKAQKGITVQVHILDLFAKDKAENNESSWQKVPVLAVWIPKDLAESWYVQE